jgi:SSS family solute:Na+ symporter
MMVIISISKPSKQNNAAAIEVNTSMFKVSNGFIVASVIITGILAALYTVFW